MAGSVQRCAHLSAIQQALPPSSAHELSSLRRACCRHQLQVRSTCSSCAGLLLSLQNAERHFR